ncbi:MAG TPA: malectin domain-containing carbohydrate-binding protein, partial [Planctomycetota bacterium]|nr:malectin domain-containing carbohydrate-binding protein [Planctomycetota bacterium]
YDAEKGLGTLHVGGKVVASHDGPDRQPLGWDAPLPDLALGRDWSAPTRLDELRIASRALEPREFLISKEAPAAVEGIVSHWRMEAPEPQSGEAAGEGSPGSSIRYNEPGTYTVRLFFAEIEGLGPGARVFDVGLQGRACLQDFDIAKEAGGPFRSIMKEIDDVEVRDYLRVRLSAKSGRKPLLNGIQVIVKSRTF